MCCLFLCVSVDISASGWERGRSLLRYCQDGLQKEMFRQTRARGTDAGPWTQQSRNRKNPKPFFLWGIWGTLLIFVYVGDVCPSTYKGVCVCRHIQPANTHKYTKGNKLSKLKQLKCPNSKNVVPFILTTYNRNSQQVPAKWPQTVCRLIKRQ